MIVGLKSCTYIKRYLIIGSIIANLNNDIVNLMGSRS